MEELIDWTAVARYLLDDMTEEERSSFEQQLDQDEAFHQVFKEINFLWDQSESLGQKLTYKLTAEELQEHIATLKELIGQEEDEWTLNAIALQKGEESNKQGQQLWTTTEELGKKYHAAMKVDMPSSLESMRAKIASIENKDEEGEKAKPSPLRIETEETENTIQLGRRNFFARIAAAVALIVSASAVGYYFTNDYSADVTFATLQTGEGEVKNISLSDGSMVWVNENSVFKYPTEFSDDSRDVLLQGEAFFDIAKDPSKPFSIKTETSNTTVLGTSFNLNATKEGEVILAVATGKVKFSAKGSNAGEIVTPNKIATLTGTEIKVEIGNVAALTKWKQATLEFHDKRFEEVVTVLERTFDVSINLENKDLANRKFSGKFEKQTIVEILDIMAEILGFSYEQEDRSFVIKK